MSHFGQLVKELRKEKDLTLDTVAKKIGSHKGYVSGIENGKVNPPSVKIILKYAKLFGRDARMLVRLAWVDKAPSIIRKDAEEFLKWCQTKNGSAPEEEVVGSGAHPGGASTAAAPQDRQGSSSARRALASPGSTGLETRNP